MSFLILKCFNVRFYLVIDAAESFSKKTGAGFIQPFIGGAVGVAVLTGPQFVLSQEAFFGQYFEVDKKGITRKGGRAFIWRMALVYRAQRQGLPIGKAHFF